MVVKLQQEPESKIDADDVLAMDGNYAKLKTSSEIMQHWYALKDKVDEYKKLMEPYEEARKSIEKAVARSLTIPEDKMESEKVSIPGIGSCSKKLVASLKVHDWSALQRWCPKNGWSEIIQKRTSQAPIESLEAEIMKGNVVLPPEIAEITSYTKLSITKARNVKK